MISGILRTNLITSLTTILSGLCVLFGQEYKPDMVQGKPSFKWPAGKQVAISLTFDDARLSQVDSGIPLLNRYDVNATFYISPGNALLRLEAWKGAVAEGHEIGNHSVNHPCSGNFDWSRAKALEDYTLERMAAELDSAARFIRNRLGVETRSFAYPCGQTFVGSGIGTQSYVPLVASMFETGRGWLGEAPNDPVFFNKSQLTAIELDGKTFDEVKKIIEAARAGGKWIVFAGHETGSAGRQTTLLSTIEELCRYASDPSSGIWIDNVHNVYSYVRSQVDGKY